MISISICACKREEPHWGARIRAVLVRRLAGDLRIPATGTIHAVLDFSSALLRPFRAVQRRATLSRRKRRGGEDGWEPDNA